MEKVKLLEKDISKKNPSRASLLALAKSIYYNYVVGKVGSQVNPEFSSSPLNHNYLPGSKLMLNVGIK